MLVSYSSSLVARWRYIWLCLTICPLLSSFFLVSCSGVSFGARPTGPTAIATPSQLPLSKLRWCKKPFILFRDEHVPTTVTPAATATPTTVATASATAIASAASTPASRLTPSTLTDWLQVKPLLGFTIYLPSTLPLNSCLVSASGTANDPVFGGSFIIGYTLPDKSPISFSEAPSRLNASDFQCSSMKNETASAPAATGAATPSLEASPAQVPILLCAGIKGTTNIVFSERGNEAFLKKTFDSLQPDVAWVPAS